MKIYRIASNNIAWHISNEKFSRFDRSMTAQGIFWFAKDREDLVNNWHGASINSRKPIWLYQVRINSDKVAGWDEYDRYMLNQLEEMGYDSISLDGDLVVFDSNNIEIVDITRVN